MTEPERDSITQVIMASQKELFEMLRVQEEVELMGLDLTMPQFKILCVMYDHGAMRMSSLAELLGKNISTATGIIDHLVEDKLIQREVDPKDRRAVVVRLTPKGYDLIDSFMRQGWRKIQALLARMSLEELQIVLQSFELFARAAHAEAEEQGKRPV